ncbi:flagellar hook protein FlgE [Paenirhodobacter hankyongi]|uniref:Flagellar hook protein FlgE n=1 Tax=Paenirhodobacter hankyongi TaxID=2294033 RepID=A0A421BLX4_9RHOB|nr:flagellar hook-basal body complex protein [Sinirhodobacter hankyongi]RLL64040.1 flagellar hook-basal body complex protein [Sinirhodobacter hankyongi]
MSISSSLNAGVAGLAANATRLATISDNIANSGTYGYKRATTDFESMVLAQTRNSGTYSAGGVRASTGRLIDERGSIVSTANATDLAVSGRGFLPVASAATYDKTQGEQPLMMTTTGSFHTDSDGVLRTDSGLVLLGWPANADGSIPTMPRDTVGGLVPVVINANQTAGDPTTAMNLGVNLPSSETGAGSSGDALPLSVEYFGNLGNSESLDITFTPTVPASGSSNEWTMVIRDSATIDDPATAADESIMGEYTLVFDNTSVNGGTLASVSTLSGGTYDPATGTVSLGVAEGLQNITLTIGKIGDANGLTQLATDFAPTSITKDGSPVGNLTAVEIDDAGFIKATYDTGFIRTVYQIPLVDVPNPNGLSALDNQTFQVSPTSGSFFLWDAGDGPTGTIEGYAREGSAVDVAQELTNLIQTQRAYSSNAKVIQTVDEMLQETTNIKR